MFNEPKLPHAEMHMRDSICRFLKVYGRLASWRTWWSLYVETHNLTAVLVSTTYTREEVSGVFENTRKAYLLKMRATKTHRKRSRG